MLFFILIRLHGAKRVWIHMLLGSWINLGMLFMENNLLDELRTNFSWIDKCWNNLLSLLEWNSDCVLIMWSSLNTLLTGNRYHAMGGQSLLFWHHHGEMEAQSTFISNNKTISECPWLSLIECTCPGLVLWTNNCLCKYSWNADLERCWIPGLCKTGDMKSALLFLNYYEKNLALVFESNPEIMLAKWRQ